MIAQFIFDKCIYYLSKSKTGLAFKFYYILRIIVVKLYNPSVEYVFYNFKITIPLSHDLPLNRAIIPKYSDNLGKIVELLYKNNSTLKVIDIGANIADTVCIVKHYSNVPILCVEGNNNFISFLEKNCSQFNSITIHKSFVGEPNLNSLKLSTKLGTANIYIDKNSVDSINLQTLDEILAIESFFENAEFLKIDTDGFDNSIIRSAEIYLKKYHPVIFFEYDPYFQSKINEDGITIFKYLEELDYCEILFFNNKGEFYELVLSNNHERIRQLHEISKNKVGLDYFDICIYTNKYSELFSSLSILKN